VNAEATLPRPQTVAPRPRRPLPALILKWFGIGCLMIAAGLGGYIGWLLWGTGLTTKAAQSDLKQTFTHVVDTKDPAQAPAAGAPAPLRGSAYAELIIPRIDLDLIVVQGTDEESLKKGPGHYPETADPWDPTGRVGIAGHRTTYLAPFYHLDSMQVGDPITLKTEYGTFDYRVTRVYEIPEPGSGIVLTQTPNPTLVLTTCNPRYSSTERLIVTADRV
jgi:sortase A